jgi:hypothetical protein
LRRITYQLALHLLKATDELRFLAPRRLSLHAVEWPSRILIHASVYTCANVAKSRLDTTFERNFRKIVALSPREFRQQHGRKVKNTRFAENFTNNAEIAATDPA